jgi:hypothetical protein
VCGARDYTFDRPAEAAHSAPYHEVVLEVQACAPGIPSTALPNGIMAVGTPKAYNTQRVPDTAMKTG